MRPAAVEVLAGLGLLESLDPVAIRTGTLIMTTRRGQTVLSDRRGLAAGAPAPQLSVHRSRLQRALLDAVRARAGASAVHVDRRLAGFEQDDGCVRARFLDRSDTAVTVAADRTGAAVPRRG